MKIFIATPALKSARTGNRTTALRWAQMLKELGHNVTVGTEFQGNHTDVLIALHARHSYPSIARYREENPTGPLIVALAGTDVYGGIQSDAKSRRALELAEKRLAENEERWRRFGRPVGNDVGSFARPASKPAFQFSGYAADSPTASEQSFDSAYSEGPCLPSCSDSDLTRLSWNKNGYRITPFGSLAGEAILTDSSTTARAFIRYLNPDTGLDQSQSTVTGQGSAFGLNIEAPKVRDFDARGLFYFKFYGGQPAANVPGLFYL
ncbi:MAG: hypothetical protein IH969_07230, partial [Candidatus Krumholzibacteriota bacterium]|nr:hypothetical protein [Candidatus Krumholzibacteriota bacterium]